MTQRFTLHTWNTYLENTHRKVLVMLVAQRLRTYSDDDEQPKGRFGETVVSDISQRAIIICCACKTLWTILIYIYSA